VVNQVVNKIKNIKHFKFICVFVASFALGCIVLSCLYFAKTPIKDAEINDLMEINGIGAIKAGQIEQFYNLCPDSTIDDVEQLNGIGKETVEKLKKEYR